MVRVKCSRRGQSYSHGADHRCPDDKPGDDNAPFDEKAWRRAYMKKYMREWRLKVKQLREAAR